MGAFPHSLQLDASPHHKASPGAQCDCVSNITAILHLHAGPPLETVLNPLFSLTCPRGDLYPTLVSANLSPNDF